jgi:FkbM family methyltransferase
MPLIHAKKTTDLIFDVGMHKGEDTAFYLRKGFRVVSFEADPELVKHCSKRFANELASGQLVIVDGAIVADTSSPTITFYRNPNVTVWGTVNPEWQARNQRMGWESEQVTVRTVDFRKCIEKYGMPYYIKIDIEGADQVCLNRLQDFVEKPDYVSIESSKVSMQDIREELELLTDLGYEHFKLIQQGTVIRQREPVPPREGKYSGAAPERDSSGLFGRDLPGNWLTRGDALRRYESIMLGYRLFGNDSFVRSNRYTRRLWQWAQKIARRPIPGWFDTHARHRSVRDI